MNLAIMQPYFMPYIGYFQLMNSVDIFVIYDNIEYSKKGWVNRNRILIDGKDQFFTIPLKKASDYLNVNERYLSDDFSKEKVKILNKLNNTYRKAPFFLDIYPLIEEVFDYQPNNLFDFIYNSIEIIKTFLEIESRLIKSSELGLDINQFRGQDKVIKICTHLNATRYINPIGGVDLYSTQSFQKEGIELNFIKSESVEYKQFNNNFVPWLSIIDVLMFNSKEDIKKQLLKFKLI